MAAPSHDYVQAVRPAHHQEGGHQVFAQASCWFHGRGEWRWKALGAQKLFAVINCMAHWRYLNGVGKGIQRASHQYD
jgi:hypothetical protein